MSNSENVSGKAKVPILTEDDIQFFCCDEIDHKPVLKSAIILERIMKRRLLFMTAKDISESRYAGEDTETISLQMQFSCSVSTRLCHVEAGSHPHTKLSPTHFRSVQANYQLKLHFMRKHPTFFHRYDIFARSCLSAPLS